MKVVVVGAGFAGIRTALSLANKKNIEVKLISTESYFEYRPALYRSATGHSPLEVAIPLRDFFGYAQNVEVVKDIIVDLDNKSSQVIGESGSVYTYDRLILSLGNVTEFFNIKGLKQFAYGVKSIHEALRLKRHIHEQLMDPKTEKNYVVIGAGATGVELSAELKTYIKKIRKKHKVRPTFNIELIEASPRVLSTMTKRYSKKVKTRLRHMGIKIHTKTAVKTETIEGIQLPNGSIESKTVVWTAGVANNPFFKKFPKVFSYGRAGRVDVDEYLMATKNIFVIGDCADTQYSGMAQTAIHDAKFVANNIIREQKNKQLIKYKPKKPVYAVPVGKYWAAVSWHGVEIYGLIGWILRRLADLKVYLSFLPIPKALSVWRSGFLDEETCPICKV